MCARRGRVVDHLAGVHGGGIRRHIQRDIEITGHIQRVNGLVAFGFLGDFMLEQWILLAMIVNRCMVILADPVIGVVLA